MLIITLLALTCCALGASIEPKIVGGWVAEKGQFPHQVSLRTPNNIYFCSGSLISTQWVLTAAHCVAGRPIGDVIAVVGTNLLNFGGFGYTLGTMVIHSGYNNQTKANDIAALMVVGTIAYTGETIRAINLATAPVPGGRNFLLSGWGVTSEGAAAYSNQLQYNELTSITVADCKQRLAGKPVYDSHQCTLVPNGQGACYGDDGGPLIYASQQVGIVSWGIPCGKGSPDVFTSIAYFRSWINTTTGV